MAIGKSQFAVRRIRQPAATPPPIAASGAWAAVSAPCLIFSVLAYAGPGLAQPEGPGPAVRATRHMVVAPHPLAAEAGLTVLRQGGSAVDAGIAVQLVLGLVEPQASGIGGGAFLVHYSAANRNVQTYDGRETAPAAVKGNAAPPPAGSGASVGVPGLLRAVELAHRTHGTLQWAKLFEPAIALAEAGFPVSPRLHRQLAARRDLVRLEPTRSYFHRPDGRPKPVGTPLVNAPYAKVLRSIAQSGPEAFYTGDVARDIVAAVRSSPGVPGILAETDLASYAAVERAAVCGMYRSYRVCSMGPPTSGGLAFLQILSILQHFDLRGLQPSSLEAAHLVIEAERLAFADRGRYIADPDFVPVPVRGLLDSSYLKDRAALIKPGRAMRKASPGQLPGTRLQSWGDDTSLEHPSTSHIAVVDSSGNALSMSASIEAVFGSGLMVRGFLLNNQLTDFSTAADRSGRPAANRTAPGKRPRSSMAPSLVFGPDARLRMVVGSAGGSGIISFVTKAVLGVLDWGLDIQHAIGLPNLTGRGGVVEIEKDTAAESLKGGLEYLGHSVVAVPLESGSQGIQVTPSGLVGGTDPRREGVALGE